MKHYLESIEQVYEALRSSSKGLTSAEAQERFERDGANKLAEPPHSPLWKKFLLQFTDPMTIVLLAAALISKGSQILAENKHNSTTGFWWVLRLLIPGVFFIVLLFHVKHSSLCASYLLANKYAYSLTGS